MRPWKKGRGPARGHAHVDPSTLAPRQQPGAQRRACCSSGARANRLYHVTSLTLASFQTPNSTHLFPSASISWAAALGPALPWAEGRGPSPEHPHQGGSPVEKLRLAAGTSCLPRMSMASRAAHARRGTGSARLSPHRSAISRHLATQTPSPRGTCCSDSAAGPTALAPRVHGPRCQLPALGLQWPLA